MPIIRYASSGFAPQFGQDLNGVDLSRDFTWSEIVWAATTLGRAHEDQGNFGIYSVYEAIYRATIIYANLRTLPNGDLGKTDAYDGADPSEKGSISYYIGMTMLRLFSYRLLNVNWLLHLDLYKEQFDAQPNGKSKPDFIGLNGNNDWLVFESKGRSERVYGQALPDLIDEAKEQARQLPDIGGEVPVAAIAAITHYQGNAIRFVMQDPAPHKDRLKLDIRKQEFIQQYTRMARSRIESRGSRDFPKFGRRFRGIDLGSLGVTIGVETDVPLDAQPEAIRGAQEVRTPLEFVGRDGAFVELGTNWSDANMALEPQDRI